MSYQNEVSKLENVLNSKTENLNEEMEKEKILKASINDELMKQTGVCENIKIKIQLLVEVLNRHEKILKETEKNIQKKGKKTEYNNLKKTIEKTKKELNETNKKFIESVRILFNCFSWRNWME